jgi:glycosidase
MRLTDLVVLLTLAMTACAPGENEADRNRDPDRETMPKSASALDVPAWTEDAIWYQIFVERFRNGDPSNDPTLADMEGSWPHMQPAGWMPTPWGWDWYRQEPWAEATGEDIFFTLQLRRYGGDLQGVLDRLDYLEELGVTALYLNPINDAPSLHKYDARNYRHVDRNFGPDPEGDVARMAAEDPNDPSTWGWTSADRLFLALVEEVHRRGMRIILDYSWNHTGIEFWAWRDVLENQAESPYAEWYEIRGFDDPTTTDTNEFSYSGWAGVHELPEWRKIGRPEGVRSGAVPGTLVPEVRELVFSVTRRWLDPNGDGDPSDGVDGFRLDVAEIVPLDFWREYRRVVREVNPEAYLVGEVWWEEWPETMFDPAPWLQGDVFDAVMNYRWYEPTRRFFATARPLLAASEYVASLDSIERGIPEPHLRAMMNLTGSHDSPRFATSIYNRGRYKYQVNPRENPRYRIDRPDRRTREIQEMILVQQFTWRGAPHVWYGDEVGMWGADDPDPRKPMVWDDLAYEDEVADPLGRRRVADPVTPDEGLREVYRRLIALRKAHERLFAEGDVTWLEVDDPNRVLAYGRHWNGERAIVAFNASEDPQALALSVEGGDWTQVYPADARIPTRIDGDTLRTQLASLSARIWVSVPGRNAGG